MTDQPYTPKTRTVRYCYIYARRASAEFNHEQVPETSEAWEEFGRWLATVEAAAEQRGAERGWDQAIDYAWDDSAIYQADAARAKSKNPYRADKEGDDGS